MNAPGWALIVGGAGALGAFLGERLRAAGWQVVASTRPGRGGDPAWAADLLDPTACAALARRVHDDPPDLLLWCAGRFRLDQAYARAHVLEDVAVNALAPYEIGLAHLEGAARAGRPLLQVHLLDAAGRRPYLRAPGYSLSRGAHESALALLARQAPEQGVVVGIRLGILDVPGRPRPAEAAIAARDALLGRVGALEELGALIDAVVDAPRAFSGAIVDLDGGLSQRRNSLQRPPGE